MTRLYRSQLSKILGGGENISSSKYHNEKITYKGETFDSRKEFEYFLILEDRLKRGEIYDLKRQVSFEIQPAFETPKGDKIRAVSYIADFVYKDRIRPRKADDKIISDEIIVHVIDVKGYKTEIYKLKKKLLAYKGIYIEEV